MTQTSSDDADAVPVRDIRYELLEAERKGLARVALATRVSTVVIRVVANIAGWVVGLGVPFGYFQLTGTEPKMTPDFAAVSTAVISAILLIGVVEANALSGSAARLYQSRAEEVVAARQRGELPRVERDRKSWSHEVAPARMSFGTSWLMAAIPMCIVLVLECAWVASDDPGDGELLAWAATAAICLGVSTLLFGAVLKLRLDSALFMQSAQTIRFELNALVVEHHGRRASGEAGPE